MKIILLIPFLILTWSCCKHIPVGIYEHIITHDSIIHTVTDTNIIVVPDSIKIFVENEILIPADCPPLTIINTDTIWAFGTFSDAYAFIKNNIQQLGIIEGKQFDVKLMAANRRTEYWKTKFHNKTITIEKKPSFWDRYKHKFIIALLIALLLFSIIIKLK